MIVERIGESLNKNTDADRLFTSHLIIEHIGKILSKRQKDESDRYDDEVSCWAVFRGKRWLKKEREQIWMKALGVPPKKITFIPPLPARLKKLISVEFEQFRKSLNEKPKRRVVKH